MVASGLLLGCSTSPRPQSVTPEAPGVFWAVGSEGFAAHVDRQVIERRDYPRSHAFRQSYGMQDATLLMINGRAVLVTRVGEFMDWTDQGWRALPVDLQRGRDEPPAVHRVVEHGGWLAMQVGYDTLVTGTVGELISGGYREEPMAYMDWLGFVGPTLHGLGVASSVQALHRHEPGGGWAAPFPLMNWSPHCVIERPDHRPVIVAYGVVFDPSPRAYEGLHNQLVPVVDTRTTVSEILSYQERTIRVNRCFSRGGATALLTVSTEVGDQLLTFGKGAMTAWDCADPDVSPWQWVDAFEIDGRWTMVDQELQTTSLEERCRPLAAGPLRAAAPSR